MGLTIILLGGFFGVAAATFTITLLGAGIFGAILTYSVIGAVVVLSWIISELVETNNARSSRLA